MGLTPIVDEPKYILNKLDRIYVFNLMCHDNVTVVKSSVKSDHCEIIAYSDHAVVAHGKNIKDLCLQKKFTQSEQSIHDACSRDSVLYSTDWRCSGWF